MLLFKYIIHHFINKQPVSTKKSWTRNIAIAHKNREHSSSIPGIDWITFQNFCIHLTKFLCHSESNAQREHRSRQRHCVPNSLAAGDKARTCELTLVRH